MENYISLPIPHKGLIVIQTGKIGQDGSIIQSKNHFFSSDKLASTFATNHLIVYASEIKNPQVLN